MVSLRRILCRLFSSARQDLADRLCTERGARTERQSSHRSAIRRLNRRYGRASEPSAVRVVHAFVDSIRWRTRNVALCANVLEIHLPPFDLGHCTTLQFLRHALLRLAMDNALALALYLSSHLSHVRLDDDGQRPLPARARTHILLFANTDRLCLQRLPLFYITLYRWAAALAAYFRSIWGWSGFFRHGEARSGTDHPAGKLRLAYSGGPYPARPPRQRLSRARPSTVDFS